MVWQLVLYTDGTREEGKFIFTVDCGRQNLMLYPLEALAGMRNGAGRGRGGGSYFHFQFFFYVLGARADPIHN